MSHNRVNRFTTQYLDSEDRFRLITETVDAENVVIWLNQRLLKRLLPLLLNWLQKQTAAAVASEPDTVQTEIVQSFAQQAARAGQVQEAPVQIRNEAHMLAWLATSIDVTIGDPSTHPHILLTFKGMDKQQASVVLQAGHLRQWLNILHDQWLLADWPMQVWPDWLRDGAAAVRPDHQVSLH